MRHVKHDPFVLLLKFHSSHPNRALHRSLVKADDFVAEQHRSGTKVLLKESHYQSIANKTQRFFLFS